MSGFDGITLNGSKVLGWSRTPSTLTVNLIARLRPEAPGYEPPSTGEDACYRWATLVFPNAQRVMGLHHILEVPQQHGPMGEAFYGFVEEMEQTEPGAYRLLGPFGEISVRSDPPRVDVDVDASESAA